jgi:molybdopterin-guanine dinucleotide biosynthesis protein A
MAIAAILAGGRGRRLGGLDKSALRVGNRTLLERQLDVLTPVVERVLIVGHAGRAMMRHNVVDVPDRVPGLGPLGGLEAALAAAGGEDVLIVACDMPNLTTEFASYLISLSDPTMWDAVVPRTNRGYHPLCAVYAASCQDAVGRRLARSQLRMTDLVDELRVRVVGDEQLAAFGDSSLLLANVNTGADLAALEALQNH